MQTSLMIYLTEQQQALLKTFHTNHFPGSNANRATQTPIHIVQNTIYHFIPCCDELNSDYEVVYYHEASNSHYANIKEVMTNYAKRASLDIPLIHFEDCKFKYILGVDMKKHYIDSEEVYLNAYGLNGFKKMHYSKTYVPIAYFFILDEAKRYMHDQRHNLKNPRIYTSDLGYANDGDLPVFYDLLLYIGEILNNNKLLG